LRVGIVEGQGDSNGRGESCRKEDSLEEHNRIFKWRLLLSRLRECMDVSSEKQTQVNMERIMYSQNLTEECSLPGRGPPLHWYYDLCGKPPA